MATAPTYWKVVVIEWVPQGKKEEEDGLKVQSVATGRLCIVLFKLLSFTVQLQPPI